MAVMPSSLLRRLGVEPERTMYFRTDDGGREAFAVGHAFFSVDRAEGAAPVVFGPDDRCELGADTLSALLLEPDVEARAMVPAIALLPTLLFLDDPGS